MRRARVIGTGLATALVLAAWPASSQFAPAPEGEAVIVAQRAIQANFKKTVCPLVETAQRLGDGLIKTRCNNNETFRIFSAGPKKDVLAMRCSAAVKLGLKGC